VICYHTTTSINVDDKWRPFGIEIVLNDGTLSNNPTTFTGDDVDVRVCMMIALALRVKIDAHVRRGVAANVISIPDLPSSPSLLSSLMPLHVKR
jgi:hypothetical protein